jgi:hypothetical protein
MSDLLHQAVRNNAEWCSLICAAYGSESRFGDAAWTCSHPAPRFYPNLVTLLPDDTATQIEEIRKLAAHLPDGWGVKDSFHALDLAPLGFEPIIQASWLRYDSADGPETGLEWRRVETPETLAQWETVWGGESHSGQPRIFLPSILADATVQVFGGYADGRLKAGGIVNHAAGVAGLSNIFASRPELVADVVRHAHGLAQGLALVGWEANGGAVQGEPLGRLQVWLHRAPQTRALP